ncbi:MAG: DUF429 domain-containing protein [Desulfurococcales archaeon]|nr:DUF429 domain-containing protein [Desulfurococcales archaeon]
MSLYALGLDLAAKERRCTGFASIEIKGEGGYLVEVKCLGNDESILTAVRRYPNSVVAIDAPIMREPAMRGVDRALISAGSRVFPPNFSWMKSLTLRAWRLSRELIRMGFDVIETHPRSVIRLAGVSGVEELLEALNIEGEVSRIKGKDLRDAVTAAAVAYCFLKTCSEVVSDGAYTIYLVKKIR